MLNDLKKQIENIQNVQKPLKAGDQKKQLKEIEKFLNDLLITVSTIKITFEIGPDCEQVVISALTVDGILNEIENHNMRYQIGDFTLLYNNTSCFKCGIDALKELICRIEEGEL